MQGRHPSPPMVGGTRALEGMDVPTITTRTLHSIRLGEVLPAIRDDLERRQLEPLEHNFWETVLGPLPSTLGEAFAEVLSHVRVPPVARGHLPRGVGPAVRRARCCRQQEPG